MDNESSLGQKQPRQIFVRCISFEDDYEIKRKSISSQNLLSFSLAPSQNTTQIFPVTSRRESSLECIDKETSEHIEDCLVRSNPFLKRLAASRCCENFNVLIIVAGGKTSQKQLTLWELYAEITKETRQIDTNFSISESSKLKSRTFNTADFPRRSSYSDFTSPTQPAQISSAHRSAALPLRRRDLRWLEASCEQDPTILVRRHVTFIILHPIRAAIMATKLILIVPEESQSLLGVLQRHMSGWMPTEIIDGVDVQIPFEMHAYETIFTTVKTLQSKQLDRLKLASEKSLSRMRKGGTLLPLNLQEEMRGIKNTASEMAATVDLYRGAINELIDSDDQMALMNLTELAKNPSLYRAPLCPEILATHEDVEELLQTYVMDYDSLSTKLKCLRDKIQNAEDLVSLRLDTSRNELLVANTAFALLSCCIGVGAYITGLFGMNLDNTLTILPQTGSFAMVWAGSTASMILMFLAVYSYLSWTGILPQRTESLKFFQQEKS